MSNTLKTFSELEYIRPDIEELAKELTILVSQINNASDSEQQLNLITKFNGLREEFDTQQTISHIRYMTNSEDSFYSNEHEYFDKHDPQITKVLGDYYKALADSKFKSEIESKFGIQILNIANSFINTVNQKVLPLLEDENKYISEYRKLLASIRVEFDNQILNLSQLTPYLQSADRSIRKSANELLAIELHSKTDEFDRIYDDLVKLRHKLALELGYKNFIELSFARLSRTDYTQKDVRKFRDVIYNYLVPNINPLLEAQKKELSLDKLSYYDLAILYKNGNPLPQGTESDLLNAASKMYQELSKDTSDFWQFMLAKKLMDLSSKQGKVPGGFATFLGKYKAPFIYANFNGTLHDVQVLTHEIGHAFQAYSSRNYALPEYTFPTLEACEIHSMSMEFLTLPWMKLFFGDRANDFKHETLQQTLRFLPYSSLVDNFQEEVYLNTDLKPSERRKLWRDLEKKYLPYKDYEGNEYYESGAAWHRQAHIFANPFYYIDYSLAGISALEIWNRSIDNFEASWNDYKKLCNVGGSCSYFGILETANLTNPFSEDGVKDILEKCLKIATATKNK